MVFNLVCCQLLSSDESLKDVILLSNNCSLVPSLKSLLHLPDEYGKGKNSDGNVHEDVVVGSNSALLFNLGTEGRCVLHREVLLEVALDVKASLMDIVLKHSVDVHHVPDMILSCFLQSSCVVLDLRFIHPLDVLIAAHLVLKPGIDSCLIEVE